MPKKKTKSEIINPDDLATKDSENNDEDTEDEEGKGGMMLEKEDIQLIYKALSHYKPTKDEELLHGILLEQFDEILECDYLDVGYR